MRVLIVEDEPVSQRALRFLLTANGFQTDAVGSAEQAEELLRQDAPVDAPVDVVVLDVDLPGRSGLHFLEWVRRFRPQAKSILVTAVEQERLRTVLGRQVLYIQKPIDFRRLLHVLHELRECA